jgi:hypothetical protein
MSLILSGTDGLSDVDGSASTPAIRGTDTNTGIFFPAADTIAFAEGGAEVARFDNAGNLGIGDTPSEKLSLRNTAGRVSIFMASGTTNQGYISYFNATQQLSFGCGVPTGTGTNGGQQVNIDVNGGLLVGTTSSSCGGLTMAQNLDARTRNTGFGLGIIGNASNTQVARFAYDTTAVGSINITGSATSYGTSSDYRLKENVAPMTGALAKVQALKPVTYTWKTDGSDGQGFIAHELAEVVPDAVIGEKDAVKTYIDEDGVEQTKPVYQGIDTSFLVATLTAAIQELKAELDSV